MQEKVELRKSQGVGFGIRIAGGTDVDPAFEGSDHVSGGREGGGGGIFSLPLAYFHGGPIGNLRDAHSRRGSRSSRREFESRRQTHSSDASQNK